MDNQKLPLIDELKGLLEQNVTEVKDQVEDVKSRFYRLYREEQQALKEAAEQAAQAAGEVLEDWQPKIDEVEEQFKELLNQYKEKRAEIARQVEAEQEQNLLRKENILNQMKEMAQSETADVMGNLQKMRDLQAEWKTIGQVPQPKAQEVWKLYNQYQEQFYDLVKINFELRDLDFKKNLEMKTLLCEAAEKLQEHPSVVEASRALQQLHDEWAEIGPVARELREELWNRFKEASTVINKKHQAYFDALHEKEQENLEKKQAIIERLTAALAEYRNEQGELDIRNVKKWEELTEMVQQTQTEWRGIGFAPKKQNQAIYEEYRALTDGFFRAKTVFYKDMRDTFADNLRRKRELLQKVLELRQSDAWQEATQQVIALQKEWRTIGPVARKYSDEIWKQFTDACDDFFNKKREADREARGERQKARGEKVMQSNDRAKLLKMYDNQQQEIKTAENNILFFTGKSSTANQLVDDMQKKIDRLKQQLLELENKINSLEEN